MALFRRSFNSFEEWYKFFTGKGLFKVLNPKAAIANFAKNYWYLLSDYLNRESVDDRDKLEVLKKILCYKEFWTNIDYEEFGKASNSKAAYLLGRTVELELVSRDSAHLLFKGFGKNVRWFLSGLGEKVEDLANFFVLGSRIAFLWNSLTGYEEEFAKGLGNYVEVFFVKCSPSVFFSFCNNLEGFAKGVAPNVRKFARAFARDGNWSSRSAADKWGDFLKGLGPAIEEFIIGLCEFNKTNSFYRFLDEVFSSKTFFLKFMDNIKLNIVAFTRGLVAANVVGIFSRYMAKRVSWSKTMICLFAENLGDKAPVFAARLGVHAETFVKAMINPHDFFDSLGNYAQDFVLALDPVVRTKVLKYIPSSAVPDSVCVGFTCSFCRSILKRGEPVSRCSKCSTLLHSACAPEARNLCPSLGCSGSLVGLTDRQTRLRDKNKK